jgi:cyclophilin family peptidyl-prolyl cis-trans isomerase/HEAT repeat protein
VALLALAPLALAPALAAAQEASVVEQLAPLLAAEDARDLQLPLFQRALVAPDSIVRRIAAVGAGRIGDLRATALLEPILMDRDSTVRLAAAFGLGLLRDTAAVQTLVDRLTGQPPLDGPTAAEAITALAKIGGRRSGEFFAGVLSGTVALTQADRGPAIQRVVAESWRLGADAPVTGLLPYMDDTLPPLRAAAIYALGRLKAPAAGNRLLLALRDEDSYIRSTAARALTRGYAESARLARSAVAGELAARAGEDPSPQVRVNALRSLGTFEDSALAGRLVPLLNDQFVGVQLQAAETLGELGGADAVKALVGATGRGPTAVRRAALVALAKADPPAYERAASPWRGSADWLDRATAAQASAAAGPGQAPTFLRDRDGRVVTLGLQAWSDVVTGADPALLGAARPLLAHRDAGVRSVAADAVGRAGDLADLPALIRAYGAAARDSFPDAALSALNAILAIRQSGAAGQARVDREFLTTVPRPADYLLRRWAEDKWPELATRWGPSTPIATGRSLEDYRDVVRRYLTSPDSVARPHVVVETEGRGAIEIELLGPDAPLTVDNFLRLVNRRFFDARRWHRVVPNFVVQDGDPRGDGFGSPGGAIRDEINRNRYEGPTVGMALSGPDTGMSQWFITLSPQPHLDGTYTVFGRVVDGTATLVRLAPGDVIRTVTRK